MSEERELAFAEENLRRAIQINPNYPTGHHWYGDFLAGRGRLDESVREMRRAQELDPLSRQIGVELGWVYYLMHRSDDAVAQIRRTLALDQNYAEGHLRLGLVQIQQGHYAEAIASLRRALALGGFYPGVAAGLAFAYAASGDRTSARKLLQDFKRRSATEYAPAFWFAAVYAGLGDNTRAIEWLQKGIDQRDIYIPENFFDPLLDPLRRDPRFPRVLMRMGLESGASQAPRSRAGLAQPLRGR